MNIFMLYIFAIISKLDVTINLWEGLEVYLAGHYGSTLFFKKIYQEVWKFVLLMLETSAINSYSFL